VIKNIKYFRSIINFNIVENITLNSGKSLDIIYGIVNKINYIDFIKEYEKNIGMV
jgi:hypothetical protein